MLQFTANKMTSKTIIELYLKFRIEINQLRILNYFLKLTYCFLIFEFKKR